MLPQSVSLGFQTHHLWLHVSDAIALPFLTSSVGGLDLGTNSQYVGWSGICLPEIRMCADVYVVCEQTLSIY